MKRWHIPFLIFLLVGTIFILAEKRVEYRTSQGGVFGTLYHITYTHNTDLTHLIERELQRVDNSLSMFNPHSTISGVNANIPVSSDSLFEQIFTLAQSISAKTDGAFDITVAPAVNAWGFGFENRRQMDSLAIDSLKQIVGYHKVAMCDGVVVKEYSATMLDCSAIAKGFGCDIVAHMFDSIGVENYMVEIGGEVVLKGVNPKGEGWHIGITKPVDDSLSVASELQTIITISNTAIATSGNYRNYYYEGGKRYAHTIDPKSCLPVEHNLLSATVLAPTCAEADAYATAMMVMGVERAMELCQEENGVEAYLIYQSDSGELMTAHSGGFPLIVE